MRCFNLDTDWIEYHAKSSAIITESTESIEQE
jgi:hypothetical protein